MASDWMWWSIGHEVVRLLGTTTVDHTETAQIVLPSRGSVQRIPAAQLLPLDQRAWSSDEVVWRAAACRAIQLLDPPGAAAVHSTSLDPLPHQLAALERGMAVNPVRLLLADEVGLGKTIEAGLIHAELKARGRVARTLVVAPKGVQLQWASEMAEHFDEEFVRVGPGGIPFDAGLDPWLAFDQVICSLDGVKPLAARAGWTSERVAEHNRLRVDNLVDAGWDMVIIDEAHHVAGSDRSVARHQLAERIASVTPNLLLLSATPHSGKSDAFARLLGLLDERFRHGLELSLQTVAPLVVRADKRTTTDNHGNALFVPRTTTLRVVDYGDRHIEQRLYEAVTEYVRHGYKQALAENRPAVGFLVLLMQRLASSSTAAVRSALERRHASIITEGTQLTLFPDHAEDWGDLTGEAQVAALHDALGAAWGDELKEVELLLDLARRAASAGIDAKAKDLLRVIDELASAEGDPNLKVVVFTEFTATQTMLLDLLEDTGIAAVAINGSLGVHERAAVQRQFRDEARVLVSTDAGGEGVNLQFAHVVINYDLPWSPSKVEQRIGRVDRIGQTHPVHAANLVMEESIDARVLEVLEHKLAVILTELGADKRDDILHSADQHAAQVYLAAMQADPLEVAADSFQRETTADASAAGALQDLVNAEVKPKSTHHRDAERWLTLADTARRQLPHAETAGGSALDNLPEIAPDEPLPRIEGRTPGYLALWEIGTGPGCRTADATFMADTGTIRPDLAERAWDAATTSAVTGSSEPLDEGTWKRLWGVGRDYVSRPSSAPAGDAPPGLILRLLIRVEP